MRESASALKEARERLTNPERLGGKMQEEQLTRPPVPPFDEESARQKVQTADYAYDTATPEKVSLAYTVDSKWRNRDEFFEGRDAIRAFLRRKWARELDYRLQKN